MNTHKSYITFISLAIILIITIVISFKPSTNEGFNTLELSDVNPENREVYLSAGENLITKESKSDFGINDIDDTVLNDYVNQVKNKSNLHKMPYHDLFSNVDDKPTISPNCKLGSSNFDEDECKKQILAVKKYQENRKILQYVKLYALNCTLNKLNRLDN